MNMSVDGISFSGNISNSSVSSKDKEKKGDNSFNAILNMSIDKQEISDDSYHVVKHEVGRTDTRKFAKRNPEAKDRFNLEKYGIGKVVKKEEKTDITDSDLNSVDESALAFQNIKQELMDLLNVSEKQLDDMMGELQLNTNDLLDIENVKSLVMNIYNNQKTELLVNEDMSSMVNDLLQKVEEVIAQVSETEEASIPVMTQQNYEDTIANISKQNEMFGNVSSEKNIEIDSNINILTQDNSSLEDKINLTVNTETSESDNLFEGENKGSDNIQQIMTNLNQAIENVVDGTGFADENPYVDSVTDLDIIKQIIDDIKVNISKDNTSMEMQLNPENLGKVHISVVEKNGVMQAQITTETEAAKHAIETNLLLLRENFQNQELKVEAIEVMVASYEFFNHEGTNDNNSDNDNIFNSSSKSINSLSDSANGDEVNEREELEVKMMKEKGNSFSYLA